MHLQSLSLTQFRNFARLDLEVPDGPVLIVGRNAQGKTSMLEAIYFLATLTSFHAESDRQLINFLEARKPIAVARLRAAFARGDRLHQVEVRIIREQTRNGVDRSRKEILVDGLKKKAGDAAGFFNAVLFLPQMLQILEGTPRHRRRYLDLALSQVQPGYSEQLNEYENILSQRNALLKQLGENGGDASQLDFWDERLSLRGTQILQARTQAIRELDLLVGRVHSELTDGGEVLRLNYQPSYDPLPAPRKQRALIDEPADRSSIPQEKIEAGFKDSLQKLRAEEISRGATSIGPHRDELRFISNGIDLGTYGSRGQVRTALLTLKLAEREWMHGRSGSWPVLLLDEVLAELDETRRADLLERVAGIGQVLLTTTDFKLFTSEFLDQATRWQIESGRLVQEELS